MPDRDSMRVPEHRSDVLKEPLPQDPPAILGIYGISQYPRLSEESEKGSRDEATHVEKLYKKQRGG